MTKNRQEVIEGKNEGTPFHELPGNLLTTTHAYLAQAYWEGEHATALRRMSKLDLYVLGKLLKDPSAMKKSLVDFKGKNFFLRATERIVHIPPMIMKDANDFDLGRQGITLENLSNWRTSFCLNDLELIPLFPKRGKSLGEVINLRDPLLFVSYTAMRALWWDFLEHQVDNYSGVLSELVRKMGKENEPKRIFCGQKITKGNETAGFSYIVGNSRIWSEAEYEPVLKGDFLLTWKKKA